MAANEIGVIETTKGTIKVSFLEDVAPNHVANFKKLANDGFYNGTIFHRVIPGFMIQAGCPHTKTSDKSRYGTGGPGSNVDAEFSDTKHVRGILSAARSGDPNSAGSQFFVMVADSFHLDGQYSAFGEVLEGMDVVDAIVSSPRDAKDIPDERIELTSVTIQAAE